MDLEHESVVVFLWNAFILEVGHQRVPWVIHSFMQWQSETELTTIQQFSLNVLLCASGRLFVFCFVAVNFLFLLMGMHV